MSYNKFFLKDGLHDKHWVGYSVMKHFDAVAFNKINSLREGSNDKSDNFYMEIIDEGVIDKALEGPEKLIQKKTWKSVYEVLADE